MWLPTIAVLGGVGGDFGRKKERERERKSLYNKTLKKSLENISRAINGLDWNRKTKKSSQEQFTREIKEFDFYCHWRC